MRKLLGLIGMLVGGYIGFLNRPAAVIVGQLPLGKIILAGANLQGVNKIFVPIAKTSFNYMLIGAVVGLLCGIILGSLLTRAKK